MAFDATKPNLSQTMGDVITSANANDVALNAATVAHIADNTAHGIPALVATQVDYTAHKLDPTAHGINTLSSNLALSVAEVVAARGVTASLSTRLGNALQMDGTVKLSSLSSKWINNSDTPSYVGTTTFSVPGDRTKVYIAGVLLRFTISGSYAYAPVVSNSFGSGVTTVTIDPAYPILSSGLSTVDLALLAWDNSVSAACTVNATNITSLTGVVAGMKIEPVENFFNGAPTANFVVNRFIATRAFSIPINAANSQFKAVTAATASTVFTLAKNGASFGTATFAAAGTSATFAAAAATSFAAGDILTITAPATPDATLANLVFNLQGILP